MTHLPPQLRTWIYGIATAAIPPLVVAGIVTADQASPWLNLAAAILGLGAAGTATAYRPTKTSVTNRGRHEAPDE